MAQTSSPVVPIPDVSPSDPPWSRAARYAAGISLALGGLLNGLPQWLSQALLGDLTFAQEVQWAAEHPVVQEIQQVALVSSALFMPLGLLGLAQVTRWRAPRLTVVGLPLALWGMWGFANILAVGYVPRVIGPPTLSAEEAVRLNEAFTGQAGLVAIALVPHLVGSFLGVLLLTVAAWRSGLFPRTACALVVGFLVWDFLLPSAGALEPHLLLVIGWTWLGVTMIRMDHRRWRTGEPR